MKNKQTEEKMSLAEYIEKNTVKAYNVKKTKSTITMLTTLVGTAIASCLFFVVLKLFDLHEIAGYVGTGVAVIVYIFLFIVPCIKLRSQDAFQVRNVKYANYKKAKKHNIELRNKLAQQIIDLSANTDNTTWYNEAKVGKLAIAKQTNNVNELRDVLADIYKVDVKKATNKIITEYAAKVGLTTAISQSETLDVALISLYELSMIKEIIFLYGFRPSDYELAKIYRAVIVNALVTYGTQNAATSIIGKIGAAGSSSILTSVIGTLATAVSQGIINSSLTISIGFQTKNYLMKEYRLAETLETIELTSEDEAYQAAILKEVKEEVEKATFKKKTPKAKEQNESTPALAPAA